MIGFDPWLHTAASIARLGNKLESLGARLVPQPENPVDLIWHDQPRAARPHRPTCIRLDFAGEETVAKLARIRTALEKERIGGLVVSDPHNLCWIFNLRGGDVPHTPIVHGYAIILGEGRPHVFIAPQKLDAATRGALAELAEIADPDEPSGDAGPAVGNRERGYGSMPKPVPMPCARASRPPEASRISALTP